MPSETAAEQLDSWTSETPNAFLLHQIERSNTLWKDNQSLYMFGYNQSL
jgi:hypothetical protein